MLWNEVLRGHNGAEDVGKTLLEWVAQQQVTLIHTQSGRTQQNAYLEHYNLTARYDWFA